MAFHAPTLNESLDPIQHIINNIASNHKAIDKNQPNRFLEPFACKPSVFVWCMGHTIRMFSHLDIVILEATTIRLAHLPPKHHEPHACEEAHLFRLKDARDGDEGHDCHSNQPHFQCLQWP